MTRIRENQSKAGLLLSRIQRRMGYDKNVAMLNHEQNYAEVEVTPFIHQVGGHTCVLQVSPDIICKPFQENEVNFYSRIPEKLKDYVPFFRGVISIQCDKHPEGISFHAKVPCNILESLQRTDNQDLPETNVSMTQTNCVTENADDKSSTDMQSSLGSWSLECVRRQIERYGFWSDNSEQNFIMLENLLTKYRKPCVMDLKMGVLPSTEQSSEEKRKLMEERWTNSTSSSLGFRICGTQVYKTSTNGYLVRDKYHGRKLDVYGVQQELRDFFHNGVFLRSDVIKAIINKLRRLCEAYKSQSSFKLFSCSLLLVYEGETTMSLNPQDLNGDSLRNGCCDDVSLSRDHPLSDSDDEMPSRGCSPCEQNVQKIDVRLIDFANAIQVERCTEKEKCLDSGIYFGLQTLIKNLENILS